MIAPMKKSHQSKVTNTHRLLYAPTSLHIYQAPIQKELPGSLLHWHCTKWLHLENSCCFFFYIVFLHYMVFNAKNQHGMATRFRFFRSHVHRVPAARCLKPGPVLLRVQRVQVHQDRANSKERERQIDGNDGDILYTDISICIFMFISIFIFTYILLSERSSVFLKYWKQLDYIRSNHKFYKQDGITLKTGGLTHKMAISIDQLQHGTQKQ